MRVGHPHTNHQTLSRAVEVFKVIRKRFSTDVQSRVKRILHVVFSELELNGGQIQLDTYYDSWERKNVVRGANAGFDMPLSNVKFRERENRVQREPTQEEIEYHKRWHPDTPLKRFYDKVPNGLLSLSFDGMDAQDSVRDPNGIEQGIASYFRQHQIRKFRRHVDAELSHRAYLLREKQLEFAYPIAVRTVAREFYFDELHRRALELKKFEVVREYVARIKEIDPNSPWITWADTYLDNFDPMRQLSMPQPPALNKHEHAGLIEKIVKALGRDENSWEHKFPDGEFHG